MATAKIPNPLIRVRELPWEKFGHGLESKPTEVTDIIEFSDYNWDVDVLPLKDDIHPTIPEYYSVFKTETKELVSVVKTKHIMPVQNHDMLKVVEGMFHDGELEFEKISQLGPAKVFATFQWNHPIDWTNDSIIPKVIVENDFTKCNGTVRIIFTPVRFACYNVFSAILPKNMLSANLAIPNSEQEIANISTTVSERLKVACDYLTRKMNSLVNTKLTKDMVDKLLAEFFPYQADSAGNIIMNNHNEAVNVKREQFLNECMNASDNQNYKGTAMQMFNALTDYDQHYVSNMSKSYNVENRMKVIDGFNNTATRAKRFMAMLPKLAKAA